MKKTIHLKGLNGLRAIAAIAVVISHTAIEIGNFGLIANIFGVGTNGKPKGLLLASYGVSIFFALSGFLITYLLLMEIEKTKKINIKKFYIRRILRIWPLYYFYLIVVLSTLLYFGLSYDFRSLPFYIFLTANIPIIINNMLPFAGHLWSIGVEEQFYLFWPWIVKHNSQKVIKKSMTIIILFLILKGIFWFLNFRFSISTPLIFISVTRMHIMAIGAIGAVIFYKKKTIINTLTSKWAQLFSWFIIFLVAINKFNISSLIDNEIVGVVTTIIILGQITRVNYIINLENRLMNFLGRISYGIYVYHPLVIYFSKRIIGNFKESTFINYFIVFSLVIGLTVILSYISYTYFESNFIKLKSKFSIINSKA